MKRIQAIFFRTAAGGEPVRDWLRALSPEDRRQIGGDIQLAEYAWPVGMPLARPLGAGLHEIRSSLSGNRIARVIFYVSMREEMILLHAFIKKTRATPSADLDLARRNKRLHEGGER